MKPVHSRPLLIMALAAPFITACASTGSDTHPFKEGWRQVRVDQIASASDIHHSAVKDCREGLSEEQRSGTTFAVLSYAYLRSRHTVILPLAEGSRIRNGDVFYAQVNACGALGTPVPAPEASITPPAR